LPPPFVACSASSYYCEILFSWPTVYRSRPCHNVSSVCRQSVTFCIVANCLKERIGNQGQKVFLASPPYFYFRFRLYGHRDGCFCLIFARTAQRSLLGGTNGLSSSKPCAYCRIVQSTAYGVPLWFKYSAGTFVVTKYHKCIKIFLGIEIISVTDVLLELKLPSFDTVMYDSHCLLKLFLYSV